MINELHKIISENNEKKDNKNAVICAIVLTHNEEINLPLSLPNLKWTDELYVVDSGSTDNTIKIAEKHRARIFVNECRPFKVTKQRNWAIENLPIKSNWILFVDADEIITEKLKKEIINSVNNADEYIAGFQLCPKYLFMGKWLKNTALFPTWHDRLFRKDLIRYTGLNQEGAWEKFKVPEGYKIKRIYEPYLHYSFKSGISRWIEKHNRYSTELAQEIIKINADRNFPKEKYRSLNFISRKIPFAAPFMRFFYLYILKVGFLDRWPGFIYSLMMSFFDFMVYLKIIELRKKKT